MNAQTPTVPNGVRPVVGDHLSHVEISTAVRQRRQAANTASVAARRARRSARDLPVAPPHRKLFVVGCGRSGTSWVQSIIARHPAVVTTQESHAYETIYEPVTAHGAQSVAGWTKVVQRRDLAERQARWVGLHWWINQQSLLDRVEWAFAQRDAAASDLAQGVIAAVFDGFYRERAGRQHTTLLEKTPGHLRYADLILSRFPDARIIEVLRDGRDVCVSMQMQALTLRWPPTDRARQIRAWRDAVQRGAALRANPAWAGRVHLVRYEDLKNDTEHEIQRLLSFAGLDANNEFITVLADGADFRHHGRTGAGSRTRRGEVGDWRNHFSPEDEELFREIAGETFADAGYPWGPPR